MKKKEVIIFGASGGLGNELVKVFLRNNYNIVCISSNIKKNIFLKTKFSKKKNCKFKVCDLSKKTDIDKIKKYIKYNYKNIELIVFASAILTVSKFINNPVKNFNNDIQINAFSFIDIFREFIKFKKGINANAIIILSNTSIVGIKNLSSYSVSKSILQSFGESINNEMEKSNILLVYPGPIKTNFDNNANVIEKKINYKINTERASPYTVAKKIYKYYSLKKNYLYFNLSTRLLYLMRGISPLFLNKIINKIYK